MKGPTSRCVCRVCRRVQHKPFAGNTVSKQQPRDVHTFAQLTWRFAVCGCVQEQAASLIKALAQYTITLQELENSLLARLANAQVRVCVMQ